MPTTTNSGLTLTQVTKIGRQTVLVGSIAIVSLIVGRVLLTAAVNYYLYLNPPPPPPPTVGFGALPPLAFPVKSQEEKPTSYRLETATGGLPTFGDRAKVFLMPQSAPNLLSDQRVKQIAAQLGYVFTPEILDTRRYRWTKSQPLQSTLEIDQQTLDFEIDSDFLSRPEILATDVLPDNFEAVSRVRSLLNDIDLLGPDMVTASGEVAYLKALGGELSPAVSYSDADYLQVDLNRTPIDDQFRMFTPNGYQGAVSAIISGAFNDLNSVVKMENHYHAVDYDQVETYPLRDTQSAWRQLQAGEGYVAQKGTNDTAIIRQVYLGYYDSFEEQPYLQPVYVFEGDGGFLGYVSALDPRYVQAAN